MAGRREMQLSTARIACMSKMRQHGASCSAVMLLSVVCTPAGAKFRNRLAGADEVDYLEKVES